MLRPHETTHSSREFRVEGSEGFEANKANKGTYELSSKGTSEISKGPT